MYTVLSPEISIPVLEKVLSNPTLEITYERKTFYTLQDQKTRDVLVCMKGGEIPLYFDIEFQTASYLPRDFYPLKSEEKFTVNMIEIRRVRGDELSFNTVYRLLTQALVKHKSDCILVKRPET